MFRGLQSPPLRLKFPAAKRALSRHLDEAGNVIRLQPYLAIGGFPSLEEAVEEAGDVPVNTG